MKDEEILKQKVVIEHLRKEIADSYVLKDANRVIQFFWALIKGVY